MKNPKFLLSTLAALSLSICPTFAAEVGIVNFASCCSDSKAGQQEQESLQTMQNQMVSLMEETEKEIKEIDAKLKDTEYLDSLSPQAEAELQAKREQLAKNAGQYQGQFYQMMQQVQYQIYQRVLSNVTKAAEKVRKEKNLDFVINKEACFAVRPDSDLDVTSSVISEMDKTFELDKAEKEAARNAEGSNVQAVEESALNAAG